VSVPVVTPPSQELGALFGDIDIYVFDQLARGRFDARRRVLDVGCGDGRNLHYLLSRGYDCHGIDRDARAVDVLIARARQLSSLDVVDRFRVGEADALPWADGTFDAVICSAVLHFADDAAHFGRIVTQMWRVLAPAGLLIARLASNIGIESAIGADGGRRVRLPDGSDRFVVDEAMLLQWTARLGGQLADPIKTTNVQGLRCMTTWCVVKREQLSDDGAQEKRLGVGWLP
jgi:SAM-dependent methyltransferase